MRKQIEHAWNNGLTLSQAAKRLTGIETKALIAVWRELKRKHGCSCISKPSREPTERELQQDVGGMTYGDWKGTTGPGKLPRDTIKATS